MNKWQSQNEARFQNFWFKKKKIKLARAGIPLSTFLSPTCFWLSLFFGSILIVGAP